MSIQAVNPLSGLELEYSDGTTGVVELRKAKQALEMRTQAGYVKAIDVYVGVESECKAIGYADLQTTCTAKIDELMVRVTIHNKDEMLRLLREAQESLRKENRAGDLQAAARYRILSMDFTACGQTELAIHMVAKEKKLIDDVAIEDFKAPLREMYRGENLSFEELGITEEEIKAHCAKNYIPLKEEIRHLVSLLRPSPSPDHHLSVASAAASPEFSSVGPRDSSPREDVLEEDLGRAMEDYLSGGYCPAREEAEARPISSRIDRDLERAGIHSDESESAFVPAPLRRGATSRATPAPKPGPKMQIYIPSILPDWSRDRFAREVAAFLAAQRSGRTRGRSPPCNERPL